jgi:type I restriction enzyme, S subunit
MTDNQKKHIEGQIPYGWIEARLGDFIDVKHGYAFKGEYFSEKLNNNLLLTPGNFKIGGGFKDNKFKYYTGEIPANYILKTNDLIITMTDLSKEGDTLGFPALIPNQTENNYLHNQRIGLVIFKNTKIDSQFLYFKMRTNDYQKFIVNSSTGSTVKHTSPTKICEFKFSLPPLPEQKAIASILTSLDDKIELLRDQNKTLEDLGQKLFLQELAENGDDWEERKLGDVVDIKYGKNLPTNNLTPTGYDVFGANGQVGFYDKFHYEQQQILISCRGEKSGVVNISNPKSFVTNNSLILERNKEFKSFTFLKNWALNYNFMSFVSGSAQPQITIESLNNAVIRIPDKKFEIEFEIIQAPIIAKILANNQQIQTLLKSRDTLLPHLMSGEIRVEFKNN